MLLSTHYYVLSLDTQASALFEAFRDSLIEVENQGFPVIGRLGGPVAEDAARLRELARQVDQCFGVYHVHEPLNLVVVGSLAMQTAFHAVTIHGSAVIGCIEGDHPGPGAGDLGRIVWPLVREAMSGVFDRAKCDLLEHAERGSLVSGLESVARAADRWPGATLLVEEHFHWRGSLQGASHDRFVSAQLDVRATLDDAVDVVIDGVLASGGDVVFMHRGTLEAQDRIALLVRE